MNKVQMFLLTLLFFASAHIFSMDSLVSIESSMVFIEANIKQYKQKIGDVEQLVDQLYNVRASAFASCPSIELIEGRLNVIDDLEKIIAQAIFDFNTHIKLLERENQVSINSIEKTPEIVEYRSKTDQSNIRFNFLKTKLDAIKLQLPQEPIVEQPFIALPNFYGTEFPATSTHSTTSSNKNKVALFLSKIFGCCSARQSTTA